jgi:hypothetical protein
VDEVLLAAKAMTAPAFDFTQAKCDANVDSPAVNTDSLTDGLVGRCRPVEFLAGISFGADRVEVFELEGDSVDSFRAQASSVALINVSPLVRPAKKTLGVHVGS